MGILTRCFLVLGRVCRCRKGSQDRKDSHSRRQLFRCVASVLMKQKCPKKQSPRRQQSVLHQRKGIVVTLASNRGVQESVNGFKSPTYPVHSYACLAVHSALEVGLPAQHEHRRCSSGLLRWIQRRQFPANGLCKDTRLGTNADERGRLDKLHGLK